MTVEEGAAGIAPIAAGISSPLQLRAGKRSARAQRERRIAASGLGLLVVLAILGTRVIGYSPSVGGSVRVDLHSGSNSINPLLAYTDTDTAVTGLISPGLLQFGDDGTLGPDLAKSWSVSDGGRLYSIKLKSGLTWQNAGPVTSRDVAYTYRLLASPSFPNHDPAWQGASVKVTGRLTLTVKLRSPDYTFGSQLTVGIVPSRFAGSKTPIGYGPYRFESVSPKGVRLGRDSNTSNPALIRQLSFSTEGPGSGAAVSCVRSFTTSKGTISIPDTRLLGIEFNLNSVSQQDVRKALLAALARSLSLSNPLPNWPQTGEPNIIPASWKAQALLRSAGWKYFAHHWHRNGEILAVDLVAGKAIGENSYVSSVIGAWQRLGITVSVHRTAFPLLVRKYLYPGQFSAAVVEWDFGSPDYNPKFLWGRQSPLNFSGQNNKSVNSAINEVQRILSPVGRDSARNRAGLLLSHDAIAVGVAPENYDCVVAGGLHGFAPPTVVSNAAGIAHALENSYVSSRIVFHDPL